MEKQFIWKYLSLLIFSLGLSYYLKISPQDPELLSWVIWSFSPYKQFPKVPCKLKEKGQERIKLRMKRLKRKGSKESNGASYLLEWRKITLLHDIKWSLSFLCMRDLLFHLFLKQTNHRHLRLEFKVAYCYTVELNRSLAGWFHKASVTLSQRLLI